VTKAIPLGLRMIAQGWPDNWKYVVVPGVVTAALGGVYWLVPSLGRPALDILITLISLTFYGAIARYYLRAKPTNGVMASSVTSRIQYFGPRLGAKDQRDSVLTSATSVSSSGIGCAS